MNSKERYVVRVELELSPDRFESMWTNREKFQIELADFLGMERGSLRIAGFSWDASSPPPPKEETIELKDFMKSLQVPRLRPKRRGSRPDGEPKLRIGGAP